MKGDEGCRPAETTEAVCDNPHCPFVTTGLSLSCSDHGEDVREQHQPHLCSHKPRGYPLPGKWTYEMHIKQTKNLNLMFFLLLFFN